MLKLRKKIQLFLLSCALFLGMAQNAAALTPEDNFYVNDYMGVLSSGNRDTMISRAERLREENGVQVVAVITDYVIGDSITSYGVKVFNEFGIGSSGDNNGLLLLVALEDGEVDIVVGDGMEGILTDSAAGRLLDDYFMPMAETGDFDSAVYDTYMQLIAYGAKSETAGYVTSPVPVTEQPAGNYPGNTGGQRGSAGRSLFGMVFLVMIVLVVVYALTRPRRSRHYGSNYPPHQPYYPPPRHRRRSSTGSFLTGMMIGSSMNRHNKGNSSKGNSMGNPPGGGMFGGGSSGGGRTSGSGSARSFGSSGGGSRPSGGRSTGGGGRTSGGGASRSFKK